MVLPDVVVRKRETIARRGTDQSDLSSMSNTKYQKDFNLLIDSKCCVRLFADNSIKGRCNNV